ncbi:MAG TPA: nitroreductase family protein [Actinomycetota bacterium]|nr:nitroreductase family protein [Actinomycetota bacterium]
MELREAIETQRAIRRLKPDPVDDEVLLRCIELATKAPSGGNRQPTEFILVRDAEIKSALAKRYREAWRVYGGLARRLRGDDERTRKIIEAVDWQVDRFENVPVVIIVTARGVSFPVPGVLRSSRYGSVYPAVQNLLLALREEGLGAALTTLPLWSQWAARRILGMPWNVEPVAAIPVGWPIGRYGPTTRRPVGKVVHADRYGNRPYRRAGSGI